MGSLDHTQLAHARTHTLPVGPLKTSDQPGSEAATYTTQHNTQTPETNIPAFSGIRTRVPSNGAPADFYALDFTATGTDCVIAYCSRFHPIDNKAQLVPPRTGR